jgi:signal transduction histidine kinase
MSGWTIVIGACSLVLAVAARALRGVGSEREALGAFGLALSFAAPMAGAPALIVVTLALIAVVHRARTKLERERETVATHLASVRIDASELVRGPSPTVSDPIARRALDTLDRRARELRSATPEVVIEPVKPGVRARFMAAMGHELRSPLNSIAGFAQLLEDGSDGPLNDAQRENVVHVRRAASELLTLLTDILDTARIEAGRVRIERRWVAPIEVLTLALERTKDKSETEDLAVDVQVQPGLDPLHVDRERLAQALSNVLRVLARGGAKLEVRVRLTSEDGARVVRFEVIDRSRTISETDAAHAFDPDPTARPSGRSLALGLALSLARDLVQLHGGDARAETIDRGTLHAIWVPAGDGKR